MLCLNTFLFSVAYNGLIRAHTHMEETIKSIFNVHNGFLVNSLNNLLNISILTTDGIKHGRIIHDVTESVMEKNLSENLCFLVKPASEIPTSVSDFVK